MDLTLTLHWWMAVPGALTLLWLYAAMRSVMTRGWDSDDLRMITVFWLLTAGPAALAGLLA